MNLAREFRGELDNMTTKKRYVIGETPIEGKIPWVDMDRLKEDINQKYAGEVLEMFRDDRHNPFYFGGRFGGVGVVITGVDHPKFADFFGDEDKMPPVKRALEEILDRKLIEGVPAS